MHIFKKLRWRHKWLDRKEDENKWRCSNYYQKNFELFIGITCRTHGQLKSFNIQQDGEQNKAKFDICQQALREHQSLDEELNKKSLKGL